MSEQAKDNWSERDSETFIDLGRYYVPQRDTQIATICDAIPPADGPVHLVELCCGEGLLARALLERFAGATLHALDGSDAMLAATARRLSPYAGRFAGGSADSVRARALNYKVTKARRRFTTEAQRHRGELHTELSCAGLTRASIQPPARTAAWIAGSSPAMTIFLLPALFGEPSSCLNAFVVQDHTHRPRGAQHQGSRLPPS